MATREGGALATLPADAPPDQIFYHLGVGRAHYVREQRALYFVDTPDGSVLPVIEAACRQTGSAPRIDLLYLDRHGFIRGAHRAVLSDAQARAVLVALRLRGLQISWAGPETTANKAQITSA